MELSFHCLCDFCHVVDHVAFLLLPHVLGVLCDECQSGCAPLSLQGIQLGQLRFLVRTTQSWLERAFMGFLENHSCVHESTFVKKPGLEARLALGHVM